MDNVHGVIRARDLVFQDIKCWCGLSHLSLRSVMRAAMQLTPTVRPSRQAVQTAVSVFDRCIPINVIRHIAES